MLDRNESWILANGKIWRLAILVAAVVTFAGPWVWDRIWVPPQYLCSAPNLRLDENFCGMPLPGTQLLAWMAGGFVSASTALAAGGLGWTEWSRQLLFSLVIFLLVLPMVSTTVSLVPRQSPRGRVFMLVAWGAALAAGLWIGLSSHPGLFWALWGIWIYVCLAAGALLMEALTIAEDRRQQMRRDG
jgi:hypothetical protein